MASKILKRGRVRWLARIQKDGIIKQKLCDTRNEALDWEARQRGHAPNQTPMACLTVLEWANRYLDYCHNRFAAKTYLEKRLTFKNLLQGIAPDVEIDRLRPVDFLEHLEKQAGERSGYAANKERKNLVAAWNWGIKFHDFPRANPVAMVERFPEERSARYIPPAEDFWRVYEAAQGQDRVMLAAFLFLAARRGEIFRLTWADVDFERRRIRLSTRKRRGGTLEHDWLPMADELQELLAWWWNNRTYPDAVHVFLCEDDFAYCRDYRGQPFKVRRRLMASLCERAGVQPFTFHAIRHLSASILYAKGYPVSVIQAILRHQNPQTTTRYLKSLGLEDTRDALASLGRGKVIPMDKKRPSRVATLKG